MSVSYGSASQLPRHRALRGWSNLPNSRRIDNQFICEYG